MVLVSWLGMMGWESQTLLLRKGICFYTCAGILQPGSGSKSSPAVLWIKFLLEAE